MMMKRRTGANGVAAAVVAVVVRAARKAAAEDGAIPGEMTGAPAGVARAKVEKNDKNPSNFAQNHQNRTNFDDFLKNLPKFHRFCYLPFR